jgi:hypothetical protein
MRYDSQPAGNIPLYCNGYQPIFPTLAMSRSIMHSAQTVECDSVLRPGSIPIARLRGQSCCRDERYVDITIAAAEPRMGQATDEISAKQIGPKRLLPMLDETAGEIDCRSSSRFVWIGGGHAPKDSSVLATHNPQVSVVRLASIDLLLEFLDRVVEWNRVLAIKVA